jgi:hypothetical protein
MNILRRTSAVLLLMLVLISGSSFMVGMHFCGGELQNIALFDKAEGCAKEKQLPPCHRHETPACCDDTSVIHDGEEFSYSKANVSVAPTFSVEVAQPPVIISEVIETASVSTPRFYNYDPPLRAPDLTLTLQVFLI